MNDDLTYSFVYERQSADAAFHGIAARELVLSLLAALPPLPEWEGCVVYQGESPLGGSTVCIGTRGAGSDQVQLKILEALERQGVRVAEVYEGGPEVAQAIATARDGRWAAGR
jgi:hypothetical protein